MMLPLHTLSLDGVSTPFVGSQSLKLPTTATDFAFRSIYVNGAAYRIGADDTWMKSVTGGSASDVSGLSFTAARSVPGAVRSTLIAMIATRPAATASPASGET